MNTPRKSPSRKRNRSPNRKRNRRSERKRNRRSERENSYNRRYSGTIDEQREKRHSWKCTWFDICS